MSKEQTLEQLRDDIESYVDTIDVAPYSSNLISMALRIIDKNYGKDKANETIDIFDLETLGYNKVAQLNKEV
tara:strand:- start:314 stop:529 length:216 start_codon:yes stop_codon:yes gene_type:complete